MTAPRHYLGKITRYAPRTIDWLLNRAIPEPNSGCWLWLGTANEAGYGTATVDGRPTRAHRMAWEIANGPIPEGLEIDHKCRNPHCVNPEHLEPVTHAENMRRSPIVGGWQRRLTHCARGHAFDAANTYHRPTGGRSCRQCKRVAK